MKFKIPDSIWLQYYGEDWFEDDDGNLEKPDYDCEPEIDDVTWQDERIFNSDIEFIRKDVSDQRIAYLKEQLRWRPVSEELPEESGWIEVKTEPLSYPPINYVRWEKGGRMWCNASPNITVMWRPIPEDEESEE